jgi:hypothetical protein
MIVKLYVILFGDLFNPFWKPRLQRRTRRYDIIERVFTKYLTRYIPQNVGIPREKKTKNEYIFSMWLQGEKNAPPIVHACWRSIKRNSGMKLIILDENNLKEYLELPDFILRRRARGQIGNAHFADIIRVELLRKYGGVWMDSTLFMTGPIPEQIMSSNFFMFLANKNNAWGYGGVQNFFIRAKNNDYLINAWGEMILSYWKNESRAMDYLVHQLMFNALIKNDACARDEFAKTLHINLSPTHTIWPCHRDAPFDQQIFERAKKQTFVQKLSYHGTENPIPGSFADKIKDM